LIVDNVAFGTSGKPALVFTVEYSVRSAMTAVCEMLDLDREIRAVTKHYRKPVSSQTPFAPRTAEGVDGSTGEDIPAL